MNNFRKTITVILIATLLLGVIAMNTWIVFRMTSQQTREAGGYQLSTVSGALESTISEAKILTMNVALSFSGYVDEGDRDKLKKVIYAKKAELISEDNGVFNVYAAGTGWDIIPDFTDRKDYVATERGWYTGAARLRGEPYVTAPYVDAMTGNICYTISVLLPDQDTVVALDYTMANIQAHISQMYSGGSDHAVIITDDGIIAGCHDENLIGKQMVKELPDYAAVYSLAKNKSGVVTSKIKADFLYENLFATRSGNGWYLIVGVSDWELYKQSFLMLGISLILSLSLFTVIIVLYIMASRSRKRAEAALSSKEEFLQGIGSELRTPLRTILDNSGIAKEKAGESTAEAFSRIHAAGETLSEKIEQILSYSSIVRTEKARKESQHRTLKGSGIRRGIRTIVVSCMAIVMVISMYINISATGAHGKAMMLNEAEHYEYQLSEWVDTQKGILDMFCSIISTNPEMLSDYDAAVKYLNEITVQYPEISVTYLANPDLNPTVIMNNGWLPEKDWRVEERQWYIDVMASDKGWIISSPYYDEQTGGYCVTFAKRVYNAETGEFLGNFGIDFFMDKLVTILGDSYSDTGYAFLVDVAGDIINHPYGSYQMSADQITNVADLPYGEIKADGTTDMFKDYDGTHKIMTAVRNEDSNFTVYAVSSFWRIYGRVILYGGLSFIAFLFCIIMVYRLLSNFIRMQENTKIRLKESADTAIAAGQAKSRFLAQMSHEIRTPINAILGMNEMILREAEDGDILEYSENIQGAGKNLLSIINSILDFSRIEDGKMEILPVEYELRTVVHNLENSISERAKAKNLEFRLHVDESLPSVLLGDDVRVTQVITNLLTNAVKYTEKGSVTLTVKNDGRDGEDVFLYVEVRDTGIGIKEEDREKLFESFERLEETRNRNIEGTGLGMSIVTKLLNMMGSELSVESEYGEGSAFSFRLRQTVVREEPIGDYAKKPENRRDRERKGDALPEIPEAKILVVDDNAMNRKVAQNLMKLFKIRPDLAESGEKCIEMVKKNKYQIIFLDHMMPGMDGLETLNQLEEQKLLTKSTKVVALTANAIVGAKEQYLSVGFDDYLSKPIEVKALEEKLLEYIPEYLISYPEEEPAGTDAGDTASGQGAGDLTVVSAEKSGKEDSAESSEDGIKSGVKENAKDPAEKGSEDNSASQEEHSVDPELEILEFFPGEDYGEEEKDAGAAADIVERLNALGLDTKAALGYCAGDRDFYLEMIRDYMASAEEREENLSQYLSEKDFHNYEILAHTLKSASKTIGDSLVFAKARELEFAAKDKNTEKLESKHPELIESLRELIERLKSVMI